MFRYKLDENGKVSELGFGNSVGASNPRGSRCLRDEGEEELSTTKDESYTYIASHLSPTTEVSNSVVVLHSFQKAS